MRKGQVLSLCLTVLSLGMTSVLNVCLTTISCVINLYNGPNILGDF